MACKWPATFSLNPNMAFCLCAWIPCISSYSHISSYSYWIRISPIHFIYHLIISFKALSSIMVTWGIKTSTNEFGGTQFSSQIKPPLIPQVRLGFQISVLLIIVFVTKHFAQFVVTKAVCHVKDVAPSYLSDLIFYHFLSLAAFSLLIP